MEGLVLSGSLFLEDAWMIVLELPAFLSRRYFGWEGTPGTALDPTSLAEGGRVIILPVF